MPLEPQELLLSYCLWYNNCCKQSMSTISQLRCLPYGRVCTASLRLLSVVSVKVVYDLHEHPISVLQNLVLIVVIISNITGIVFYN